jgi:hypothetical protein
MSTASLLFETEGDITFSSDKKNLKVDSTKKIVTYLKIFDKVTTIQGTPILSFPRDDRDKTKEPEILIGHQGVNFVIVDIEVRCRSPTSRVTIEKETFFKCKRLVDFTVIGELRRLRVGQNAFAQSDLKRFAIQTKQTLKRVIVDESAFRKTPLETFTVPSVNHLEFSENCFQETDIKEMVVPEGLLTLRLGEGSFSDCSKLTRFVTSNNHRLYKVTEEKRYVADVVPCSLFYGCERLEEVSIPCIPVFQHPDDPKVEDSGRYRVPFTVEESAFEGCKELRRPKFKFVDSVLPIQNELQDTKSKLQEKNDIIQRNKDSLKFIKKALCSVNIPGIETQQLCSDLQAITRGGEQPNTELNLSALSNVIGDLVNSVSSSVQNIQVEPKKEKSNTGLYLLIGVVLLLVVFAVYRKQSSS